MKRQFQAKSSEHHGSYLVEKSWVRSKYTRTQGRGQHQVLSQSSEPPFTSCGSGATPSRTKREYEMSKISMLRNSEFKRGERHTWTFHPLSTGIPRNLGLSELIRGVDAASHIKRRPPDARSQRKMKIDP